MTLSLTRLLKALTMSVLATAFFAGTTAAETTAPPLMEGDYSQTWSRFLSAEELRLQISMNSQTQVIDIRKEKYRKKGMIPGAISIPFSEWRGPKTRPGKPPTEEALEALLGENGIDIERPIAIYNHTGKTVQTGRAAIVYWILKSGGAEQLAILNGGFKGWRAQEFPETLSAHEPEPITVDLTYRYDWWADPVEIFAVASGQTDGAILDARLDGQVKKAIKTGKPLQSMPMAQFVPASFFTNPLAEKNHSSDAKSKFRESLLNRGIELGEGFLISVCQTGELSALSWFYASEIVEIEKVLYYPDALQGWKSDGGYLFGLQPS